MSPDEKFLSQDEVDALLNGVAGAQESSPSAQTADTRVRPFDLTSQERIVRGRMATLELINERFARLFRIGLFNLLRRNTGVAAENVQVLKYGEFIRHLVVPTNLNLVHVKPLRGTALVVLDPALVFLIVDNFFGGDGRFHTRIEGREFTQTEMRTVQRVLGIVFETYAKAWESVYPIELEYIRSEVNTQFANIATPNEMVVATSFQVDLGQQGGSMHVCLPYSMLDPIRELLSSNLQGESLTRDQRWVQQMKRQIQSAQVEAVADLCTVESTLGQVMNMRAGDVLPVELPETVELRVDGVPVMECSYGQLNGHYALRVEKLIGGLGAAAQGGPDGQ
jgi:flagellar motor switch protein FliM